MPMTVESKDRLLSELSRLEAESNQRLDDDSLKVIAELRSRGVLSDADWTRIREFLKGRAGPPFGRQTDRT